MKHLFTFMLSVFLLVQTTQSHASVFVWWTSDRTLAGESALIVGDNLDKVTQTILETPTGLITLPILKKQYNQLVIRLPKDLAYNCYLLRLYTLDSNKKYTKTWLNQPKTDWLQGDMGTSKASTVGSVSIFGKNIDLLALKTATLIDNNQQKYNINLISADAWHAEFKLPPSIKSGQYVLAFNQTFAEYTAPTLHITVVQKPTLAKRRINIKEFNPSNNKTIDDTPKFVEALNSLAASGGGTLYLPEGNYQLQSTLSIPAGVSIEGAGSNSTSLVWSNLAHKESSLVLLNSNTAIKGISLYYDGAAFGISSSLDSSIENVYIGDITIRMSAYRGHITPDRLMDTYNKILDRFGNKLDSIRLKGRNIEITNSDIYGSGRSLYLYDSHGVNIHNNKFYNGRRGWYSISGCSEIIFENNTITGSDLMASGGGFNTLGDIPVSRNIYFSKNDLSMFNGWDREALTSDGGGGVYFGKAENISPTTLQINPNELTPNIDTTKYKGAGLFVVNGMGTGQYARIISIQDDIVEIDKPLLQPLDGSSKITIGPLQENYLIVNNTFTDAGAAIQFFGAALNHVIYDNKAVRTSGIHIVGLWYRGYQPAWYTLVAHNTIEAASVQRRYNPTRAVLEKSTISVTARSHIDQAQLNLVFGAAIKNNTLREQNTISITGAFVENSNMDGILVDGNHTEGVVVKNSKAAYILLK